MAKTYVMTTMNGTHPNGVVVPRLYNYMKNFEVKCGTTQWALVIVDDGVAIPPEADADPQVRVIPDTDLDVPLTPLQRQFLNNQFADMDFGITADDGDTLRMVFEKMGNAMGHSSDFGVHL
jgi:hypothetical protein